MSLHHRSLVGVYDVAGKRKTWICTFANNQHELGELGGNVLLTPFARAILLDGCVGTLLLVDEACTPMTRAWCVLEGWVTRVHAAGKRFDVAAMIPEGTQTYGDDVNGYKDVEPGPALRMDLGAGALKEPVSYTHLTLPTILRV